MDFELISNVVLLDTLDAERRRFTLSDKDLMLAMVNELIRRNVYPARPSDKYPQNTNSTLTMVEYWGAWWHEWKGVMTCPACGSDWRDLRSGPPFSREIGIYSRDQDMTMAYRCPDCGKEFPR